MSLDPNTTPPCLAFGHVNSPSLLTSFKSSQTMDLHAKKMRKGSFSRLVELVSRH